MPSRPSRPSDGSDISTEADTGQSGWGTGPPPQENETVEKTGLGGGGGGGRTCALCGHAVHEGMHCQERLPRYRSLMVEISLRHWPWFSLTLIERRCGCCLRCRGRGAGRRG